MITDKTLRAEISGIVLRLIDTRRSVSYIDIKRTLQDKQIYNELTMEDINEHLELLEKLRYFPEVYRKLVSTCTIGKKSSKNIVYACPSINMNVDKFVESIRHLLGDDVQIIGVNQNG